MKTIVVLLATAATLCGLPAFASSVPQAGTATSAAATAPPDTAAIALAVAALQQRAENAALASIAARTMPRAYAISEAALRGGTLTGASFWSGVAAAPRSLRW
jgi:hypothetical protein